MPREGFEPTPPCRGADFKSAASTLPPPGLVRRFQTKEQKGRWSPFCSVLPDAMEATGGLEPPNRAFAELRLNHLATSPCLYCTIFWCRGGDLNSYGFAPTAPSRPRVYQFHHLGSRRPILAGVGGLEPPTCGFGDRCSSQLSYTPVKAHTITQGYMPNLTIWYPCPDSNRGTRFRKPMLCPPELQGPVSAPFSPVSTGTKHRLACIF